MKSLKEIRSKGAAKLSSDTRIRGTVSFPARKRGRVGYHRIQAEKQDLRRRFLPRAPEFDDLSNSSAAVSSESNAPAN